MNGLNMSDEADGPRPFSLSDELAAVHERLDASRKARNKALTSYEETGAGLAGQAIERLAEYDHDDRALLIRSAARATSQDVNSFSEVDLRLMAASGFADGGASQVAMKAQTHLVEAGLNTMAERLDLLQAAMNAMANDNVAVARPLRRRLADLEPFEQKAVAVSRQAIEAGNACATALQATAHVLDLRQAAFSAYLGEDVDFLAILEQFKETFATEGVFEGSAHVLTEVAELVAPGVPIAGTLVMIARISWDIRSKLQSLRAPTPARGDVDDMLDFGQQIQFELETAENVIGLLDQVRELATLDLEQVA